MSYRELREMPLRTFWMLSRNINRVQAENSLRMMNAFGAAQSAEGYRKAAENLQREAGELILDEPPEPVGMEQMHGLMKALQAGAK